MSAPSIALQQSTIRNYAKQLRLPTLGGQFARLAEEAIKEKQSHVSYLEALLAAELEEREHNTVTRRLHEARLQGAKRVEVLLDFGNAGLGLGTACGGEHQDDSGQDG